MSISPSRSGAVFGPTAVIVPVIDLQYVDATLNGQVVRLKIDLGYAGEVSLSDDAWKRVAIAGTVARGTSTTADGVAKDVQAGRATLKMGTITGDVVVSNGHVSDRSDGLLGAAFLLKGAMRLDLPGKRLILWPPSKPATPPSTSAAAATK